MQEKISVKEYKSMEDLTGEQEKKPDLRRLNFMLSKKNYYWLDENGIFRIESLLQKELDNMSLRDQLLRLGGLSPDFSLCRFLRNQQSFKSIMHSISPEAIHALSTCFFETASTRNIMYMKWPKDINLLTFMSPTTGISEAILLEKVLEKRNANTWSNYCWGLCRKN